MRYEVSDLGTLLREFFPELTIDDHVVNRNVWDLDTFIDAGDNDGEKYQHQEDWEKLDNFLEGIEFYRGFEPELTEQESMNKIILALLKSYGVDRGSAVKGMSFYTIAPLTRITYCAENIRLLNDFCIDLFQKKAKKYFENCWWVIESGKNADRPNLHVHVLCDFLKKHNFRRDLVSCWRRHFGSEQWSDITYRIYDKKKGKFNCGIDMKACNTALIQQDKLAYMKNGEKGSHENFTDLGLSGEFHISEF